MLPVKYNIDNETPLIIQGQALSDSDRPFSQAYAMQKRLRGFMKAWQRMLVQGH